MIKPIRHAKSTMVHISVNTIPLYFFCWKWQLILIPESKSGPCIFQRSACIVDSVRLTYTEYESLQIQLGVLSPSVVDWVCLLCFYLKRFLVYRQERTGWDVKAGGRLGCCDRGIVEFGILRGENQVYSRITTLDFKNRLWTVQKTAWKNTMGYCPYRQEDDQKSQLIFKDHLLQVQDWPIPFGRRSCKCGRSSCDGQGAPDKTGI